MTLNVWLPLTGMFALGVGLRLFARATKAYRSKLRDYPTRWAFVVNNWDVFLLRSAFNTGFYALWLLKPGLMSQGITYLGVSQNIANWLTVPPTLGTALGFGMFVDVALDQVQILISTSPKLAWLPDVFKGEIPCYNTDMVNVGQLDTPVPSVPDTNVPQTTTASKPTLGE